jgi:hypothetical protein
MPAEESDFEDRAGRGTLRIEIGGVWIIGLRKGEVMH